MKKLITLFAIILFAVSLNAQIPNKMTYQAVVRDASDKLISNKTIGIKTSILKGTTVVYSEIYNPNPMTNQNGLVTLEIGGGTALTGDFTTIDWTDGPYFVKTEIDPNGGTSYTIQGTSQLLSVPYAFYAKTSSPVTEADPIFRASPANIITGTDITNWNNKLDAEVDGSTTNELQTLSVNGNQLSISDGNSVTLPTGSGGDQWGSQVVQSDASLSGDGTAANPLRVEATAFDGWDKDVSDDFSGDYGDLSNKPVTFYEIGGTTPPNAITDNMYHTGNVIIGTNQISPSPDKLFIKTDRGNAIYNEIEFTRSHVGYVIKNKLTANSNSSTPKIFNTAISNSIDGESDIPEICVSNTISNTGSGFHYGTQNQLYGSGTGTQIGTRNYISNTGSGTHYGVYNYLSGSGNGNHYGIYNYLSGNSSGAKYGVFSKILSSANGTHYGIYSEAEKTNSYAGYFKGDVYVSQKVKGDHSGSADMKAYIYGRVAATGSIETDGSSDGFTCERTATGRFKITFTNSPGSATKYIVVANSYGSTTPSVVNVTQSSNYFTIHIHELDGTYANWYFNFVVYKK